MPSIDYLGEPLYETLITAAGGFTLRWPGGASCTLEPLEPGERGFAVGVAVHCGPGSDYKVRASDDTEHGEVRVSIDTRPTEPTAMTWIRRSCSTPNRRSRHEQSKNRGSRRALHI